MKEKSFILPEVTAEQTQTEKSVASKTKGRYPCPCCGCLTLPVEKSAAIAFICPVCYWENDVFIARDDEPSDENRGITLQDARRNYRTFGACCRERLSLVRKPKPEELPN